MRQNTITRREFSVRSCAGLTAAALPATLDAASIKDGFRLRYLLASAMYGAEQIGAILPEVKKTGATAIDLWPRPHGTQREEIDALGHDRFKELLEQHDVRLGAIACYRYGPFKLREEMRIARALGGSDVVLVCTAKGPSNLNGGELKAAIGTFVEKMEPHAAVAEETGCVIAIENHSGSLLAAPDSIRWFAEFAKSDHLGIAFAPHHLPQDAELLAGIIRNTAAKIKFFYAQQHGMGSRKKLPKEQELLQMPGRGELDFAPLLAALCAAKYSGWTEIFMHPVPRGVPILDSNAAVTAEINRARGYLDDHLRNI